MNLLDKNSRLRNLCKFLLLFSSPFLHIRQLEINLLVQEGSLLRVQLHLQSLLCEHLQLLFGHIVQIDFSQAISDGVDDLAISDSLSLEAGKAECAWRTRCSLRKWAARARWETSGWRW